MDKVKAFNMIRLLVLLCTCACTFKQRLNPYTISIIIVIVQCYKNLGTHPLSFYFKLK